MRILPTLQWLWLLPHCVPLLWPCLLANILGQFDRQMPKQSSVVRSLAFSLSGAFWQYGFTWPTLRMRRYSPAGVLAKRLILSYRWLYISIQSVWQSARVCCNPCAMMNKSVISRQGCLLHNIDIVSGPRTTWQKALRTGASNILVTKICHQVAVDSRLKGQNNYSGKTTQHNPRRKDRKLGNWDRDRLTA